MGLRKLLAIFTICCGSFLLMGMGRMGRVNIDMTGDPKYSSLIGSEYRTLQDFVVYQHSDKRTQIIDYFGHGSYVPKREEMKEKFPFRYENKKILGVLPKGSIFKVKEIREEGPHSGTFTYTYAETTKSSNPSFIGERVLVSDLTEVLSDPPEFKPDLVEKIE